MVIRAPIIQRTMILADISSLKALSFTSLVSLLLTGIPVIAAAQTFQPPQLSLPQGLMLMDAKCGYKQLTFERPKQRLPGRREPALYRCGGPTPPIPLTALMPESNLGVTTLARPTFFWYLPKTSIRQAEFVLLDRNERPLYTTRLSIEGQSGIFSFQLPLQAPALEVDKPYRWKFELLTELDEEQRPGNPSVAGWVIRIQPTSKLVKQVQAARLRDRPNIYAQQGIWHETLTSLVDVVCAAPNDRTLTGDWQQLMRSVQLPKVAQETLVGCKGKQN